MIPRPAAIHDVFVGGELARRANLNFDRLEQTKYEPDHVFLTEEQSGHWPGDTEGRTVLALVLLTQATRRPARYLDEILGRFPQKMNPLGYFGPIEPEGCASEQQLASHGWVLRALCEEYLRTRADAIRQMIERIITNLVLPTSGMH